MQRRSHSPESLPLSVLKVWVAFLLTSLSISASPSAAFHEDAAVETQPFSPSFISPEDVAAFSNTTANGVRREGVDTALRKYAYMALSHARTGIIYNVSLPPFLDGIFCQAMRVRAGSARKRGLLFNEFTIPQGMVVQTGGPFVIMVYRRIFNFTLYSAPPGYAFASSVVGIVIYTNLNTTLDDLPLPEMTVLSPNASITAKLPISDQSLDIRRNTTVPFGCAFYDINGTASFTNISTYPNTCSFKILTDVALIIPESVIVAAPPPPSPPPPAPAPAHAGSLSTPSKDKSNLWQIVGVAIIGGIVGIILLIVIIGMGAKAGTECQMTKVDEPPDDEETLQTSLIGHTRAPTAAGVRTRPILETGSLHT